jgi:gamma-glutamyltranspeptidase/glutathione hydrolase
MRQPSMVKVLGICLSLVLVACVHQNKSQTSHEATGNRFIVSTQGEATTRAARDMLLRGGNVIDAAVAASFVISVERPQSTGIAGGGFMMVHFAKTSEDIALDFREVAPKAASEKMFQNNKGEVIAGRSTDGALAVGVPGTVAGLLDIHKRYGKLPLETVMQPAIDLAMRGFPVYPHLAKALADRKQILFQSTEARRVFFNPDGDVLKLGSMLKQANLAKVLREIAAKGRDGFYRGWVADAIVAEQKRLGGLITREDLRRYVPTYRQPVRGRFAGYEVLSMPPPSSGGAHVIEILNMLEGFPLKNQGMMSPLSIHQTSAAMQLAFFDRAKYLGDSDFVKVPLRALTSDEYADARRKLINPAKAMRIMDVTATDPAGYESSETTHFSIADSEGNVVSSTQTINGWFGSGLVVPGTGVVLNNEMDDFSAKPGVPNKFGVIGGSANANAIAPAKRPLSSMSPTIVTKNGKAILALGSPSGSQIINCVVHTILNYLTYDLSLWESVTRQRYHHQWTPDEILVESPGFAPDVQTKLEAMGYHIRTGDIGCKVQAIAFEDGQLRGVSDPRGEGMAASEAAPIAAKAKSEEAVTRD